MNDPETNESDISDAQFDEELERILDGMSGEELLAIPGLYEVVSEHLNNQVIENIEGRRAEE